jgi:hypothetical protein
MACFRIKLSTIAVVPTIILENSLYNSSATPSLPPPNHHPPEWRPAQNFLEKNNHFAASSILVFFSKQKYKNYLKRNILENHI